jgi:hypothetical protein
MKKNIIYIIAVFIAVASCDILDIKPLNIITDEDIFTTESGIDAYFVSLYNWNSLPIEDFRFGAQSQDGSFPGCNNFDQGYPDPVLCYLSGESAHLRGTSSLPNGTTNAWWGYKPVRNVNSFMKTLLDYKSNFPEEKLNTWLGEAYFLRAFMYFSMVKRYGGVPIVKEPQVYTGNNIEELQIPRETEKTSYDFILSDLDEAIKLLPENNNLSIVNYTARINKYVAYAFKSRVALFAGSIARYGTVKNNELQGIPSSHAHAYFEAAYEAADAVIKSGKYKLYRAQSDKADNFYRLFVDESSANTERIFWREYSYPDKTHNFDLLAISSQVRASAGYSSWYTPTLGMVEMFEYLDDPDGSLDLDKEYDHPLDLFENKDFRCKGSVILPYDTWRSDTIRVRMGVIAGGTKYPGSGGSLVVEIPGYGKVTVNEAGGIGGNEQTFTGFYLRKYVNDAYERNYLGFHKSGQDYIVIRYGEVLLNLAEAAVEKNNPDISGAKDALNDLRDRAGISLLSEPDVSVERVRKERMVELAFENHRFWDMRRWRNADKFFNNSFVEALHPWYNLDNGKWSFTRANMLYAYNFEEKTYYERIPTGEISKNPKLIQNDGY